LAGDDDYTTPAALRYPVPGPGVWRTTRMPTVDSLSIVSWTTISRAAGRWPVQADGSSNLHAGRRASQAPTTLLLRFDGRDATARGWPDHGPAIQISGHVTSGGVGVSGVEMTGLPGNPMTNLRATTRPRSATAGRTVTPTRMVCLHSGLAQLFKRHSDQTNQDYETPGLMRTISGTVTSEGHALADVTMIGLPGNPVVNASGFYSASVPYEWKRNGHPDAGWIRIYAGVDAIFENYCGPNAGLHSGVEHLRDLGECDVRDEPDRGRDYHLFGYSSIPRLRRRTGPIPTASGGDDDDGDAEPSVVRILGSREPHVTAIAADQRVRTSGRRRSIRV